MAPSASQIAGAVLEESILQLLAWAGYRPIGFGQGDPTVVDGAPPFTLRGRGSQHQIDAVADPIYSLPFSNPARLLIEAKAYSAGRSVGLPVVRNAVGTVRDLAEFWVGSGQNVGMRRYNYRYAIFSTSGFTSPAQEYAYAQDVYLLPLRRSTFLLPIVRAIDGIRSHFDDADAWPEGQRLSDYREIVRRRLQDGDGEEDDELNPLVEAHRSVGGGVIGMALQRFPLFLVPSSPTVLRQLEDGFEVRIVRGDDGGWLMTRANETLFAFDLPEELVALYSTTGELGPLEAVNLKLAALRTIDVVVSEPNLRRPRLVQLRTDVEWLQEIQARLGGP